MHEAHRSIENPLQQHDGVGILTAAEAAFKAVLESDAMITRFIVTQSRATRSLLKMIQRDEVRELIRRHRVVDRIMDDAGRALELARWDARDGRRIVVVATGPTAVSGLRALEQFGEVPLGESEAVAVLLEDPGNAPEIRPRIVSAGLPMIEATSVGHVRDAIEQALRLSRSARRPCVIVAEREIFHASATIDLRPNRIGEQPPAGPARRRGPRWEEVGGPLRVTRRLELNQSRSMPSPGEQADVGFVVTGQGDRALRRLEVILGVEGRLPTVHLAVTQPLDEAVLERLMLRCRSVVVIEPLGQTVETSLVRIAQRLSQDGREAALIWGKMLPDGTEAPRLVHPSPLARALAPLLENIVTGTTLASCLSEPPQEIPIHLDQPRFGDRGHANELRSHIEAAMEALQAEYTGDDDADDEMNASIEPVRWWMDGRWFGPAEGRTVVAEVWAESNFRRVGAAAVRQAAHAGSAWFIILAAGPPPSGVDLEGLVAGATPADRAEHVRVIRRRGGMPGEVRRALRDASAFIGLTVVIVEDGPPPRFDVASIDQSIRAIDKIGYHSSQRITWPADRACVIRQPSDLKRRELIAVEEAAAAKTTFVIDTLAARWPPRFGGRVHPLVEQVKVHRTQPPRRGVQSGEVPRQPEFLHANQPVWYAHLAGIRGGGAGIVGDILKRGGCSAGYHVELAIDPTPIGPGRRASAQMTFSRPRDLQETASVPPVVPWGEADLLLGYDRAAVLRAVDPEWPLQVASSGRTSIFVNTGLFDDELEDVDDAIEQAEQISNYLRLVGRTDYVVSADVTGSCRYRFHNERLADVVLLGLAWQSGSVPLSLDAMHQAIQGVQEAGTARLKEAFEYGRAAWLNADELLNPQEPALEPGRRSVRRYRLMLAKRQLAGGDRAGRFRRLAERALEDVPGLLETHLGREAHRDFIVALRRCVTWGGFEMAERFADRIISLYRVDRGDTGRALVRAAVLPLAEALLIRDAVYIASMSIGAEHRRQTRRRLNLRRGRNDRISVRYLTRIEFTCIRWRLRVDLRSSDWVAHVLAAMRFVLPYRIRGRRGQRGVRELVSEVIMQATSAPPEEYSQWRAVLEHLHVYALDGRLRRISPAGLRREIRRARQGQVD
jgi:Pyruvate/2-oxoacid:ferredoxin oxidoreductase gamma subunit